MTSSFYVLLLLMAGGLHLVTSNPVSTTAAETTATIEASATTAVTSDSWRCSNGGSINVQWHCDGDNDCGDGSDEIGCARSTCPPSNHWPCLTSGRCIPVRWRCDGERDCSDGSDEAGCAATAAAEAIAVTAATTEAATTVRNWLCNNGRSIPVHWRCDRENDCGDGSDEIECDGITCAPSTHWPCVTDGRCVPIRWKCDTERDCPDGSDEAGCAARMCRLDKEWQCASGPCIPRSWRCDREIDCQDASDEQNCGTPV